MKQFLFKPMKEQPPTFARPLKTVVTGELANRLHAFDTQIRYGNYAEVDSSKQLIRFYRTETFFKKTDPIVMKLKEFDHYQLWEDGSACSRNDLGYAYTGQILPEGKLHGGKHAVPGQRIKKQYVYKCYLTVFFSYQAHADIAICLDLISLRTQTESIGYRNTVESLYTFLDFLDSLQNCGLESK